MNTKLFILKEVRKRGELRSSDVVKQLGISRQTAAQHLRELTEQNKLIRLGTTRDARYIPYSVSKAKLNRPEGAAFSAVLKTKGLSEDRVWDQANIRLSLQRRLSAKAYGIVTYAFTEMVNNAIDHSHAKFVRAEIRLIKTELEFKVIDRGIGAFESVRRRFGLKDHYEALEHLMKGKQTTDPARHSGQGLFFTSKAADRFSLESAKLKWTVDNEGNDLFVEESKQLVKGTQVTFKLKRSSRKDLKHIFDEYSNDDFEFDKSIVLVKLSPRAGEHVSRSEAKRLLFGLEKFKRIVFDFNGVSSIGQGFADEIFRIFPRAHPQLQIDTQGMNAAVLFLVEQARRSTT